MNSKRLFLRWDTFRWIPICVLFAGATFKAWYAPQIVAGSGLLSDEWFLLTVVFVEAAAAVLILASPRPLAWRLTIALFATLSCAAAYALWTGQDCDCFGKGIGPRYTLPLDLGILLLALACMPKPLADDQARQIKRALVMANGVGFLFAGVGLVYTQSAELNDPIQFMLADSMIDQRWPLTEEYHPDLEALRTGQWMVLVVRHDCSHCRELIETYFDEPRPRSAQERFATFVAGESTWPFVLDRVALDLADAPTIAWPEDEPFVASPAVFILNDGTVVQAADGNDADDFVVGLFADDG